MKNLKLRTNILTFTYIIYGIFTILYWSQLQKGLSSFTSIYSGIQVLCIILLIINYFISSLNAKNILLYIGIVLYSFITLFITHESIFLMFILFFFAAKNIDYHLVLKKDIIVKIGLFFLIIILSKIGVLENTIFYRSTNNINGAIRQTLGFNYPTALMYVALVIGLEWILVRGSKITYIELVILSYFGYVVGTISDVRAESWMLFLACLGTLIINKFKINNLNKLYDNFILKSLLVLLPEFICVFSYLFTILITTYSSHYVAINNLMSNRLTFFQFFLNNYGLHIFPTKVIVSLSNMPTVIDNLYLYLGIKLGIINLFIYLGISSFLIFNIIKRKDLNMLFIIILFVILNFVEYGDITPVVSIYCLAWTKYSDFKGLD